MSAHHDTPTATRQPAPPDAVGHPAGPDAAAAPPPRAGLALTLLCLAQFMLVLDVTVMNVALPQISAEIGLDGRGAAWAIAAYAIAFGGLLLLGGRLADLFGSRRMVLTGLAVFTAASLAAGLSDGAAALLAARGAQGVGAALLSPAALSAIVQLFSGPGRNRALGVWAGVGASGAAVGVLLGGLLVGGPGWRWIFFVNVPVGVAVAVALPLVVPALRARARGRVDVAGAVLATLGMAALVAAVGTDVEPGFAWGAAAVAVVSLVAFVHVEQRAAEPLVALSLFRRRSVAAGVLLMLVATGLLVGGFFLLSFRLQVGLGWSATGTGAAFLPIALGALVGAAAAGRAITRLGAPAVVPLALLLAAGGFALAATNPDSVPVLIGAVTMVTVGAGAGLVCATTTGLSSAGEAESGVLSGVVNTFHELGAAVGATVFSTIAAVSLVAGGPSDGFVRAFWVAAGVAAAAAVVGHVVTPAGAGQAAPGTTPSGQRRMSFH